MFPSRPQRPKGMGFGGFSVQAKKPKANALTQPGNKFVGSTTSSKDLFKPEDKGESELYNPFEPTIEQVELPSKQEKKTKKKRKS